MRSALRIGLAMALVSGVATTPTNAALTVYYHAGGWDAFSGPDDNGKPVCGIGTTNPADQRSFSLRFEIGGDIVNFRARRPTWNIPAGTLLSVVMQIGLDTPWNMQGVGNGQTVEWAVYRSTMQTFDAQFRRAGSMSLTFPSGNEPPWTVTLAGSTAISNAFGRCVTDLAKRAPGAAPEPAAPSGQAATQPFGEAPAQQPAPGSPSQPSAPAGAAPAPR
jgi:hypothetical protein